MAEFDQAWCLSEFLTVAGIPTERSNPTDAQVYQLLSSGCRRIQRLLAQHVPAAVAIHEELTTADDGVTYTFVYFPFGHLELRDGNCGDLLFPGSDWDTGLNTYLLKGDTVRFPENEARTFDDGLWAWYVPEHGAVNATTAPTLIQPALRAAIYDAAAEYAMQGGAIDPSPYVALRNRELWGDPTMPGDEGMIGLLKRQAFGQGAPATHALQSYWWRGNGWSGGT